MTFFVAILSTLVGFVGFIGGATITAFFLRRARRKKLAALDELETSLPAKVPDTCPKCGSTGREAKTGMPYAFPARPAFGKPHHIERLPSVDSPEHLLHICYECQFQFMTSAKDHTHG